MTDMNAMLGKLKNKSILVVMGGTAAEREISLLTGQAMLKALRDLRLKVTGLDFKTPQALMKILAFKPRLVVNALHGPGGEDGRLQGFLEWNGIPYTGSGVLASALAMDKHRAKTMMLATGLPTAPWVLMKKKTGPWPRHLTWPVVVKPNDQGSAIGVSLVTKRAGLQPALDQALCFGHEVMVEKYIKGREISIGLLQGRALPVIEIVPKKTFYDYEAKYVAGMSEHIIPARLSAAKTKEVQALAERTAQVFGCKGTPRIDMIVASNGKVFILEVNTLPGMTATSLLPEAASKAGIRFDELMLRLIMDALEQRR